MAKLLVHESAGVREFEIVDNEVHMGRELDNTLRLPDPSISRHHCVLRKVGEVYEIQDLQSSNGVLVNGNRVQTSPLRNGDRITLGQVQLTFEDPRPEPAPTVAISREEVPAPPLGTVRMSAAELAAIHTGNGAPPAGNQGPTGANPTLSPAAPVPPAPPVAPPPVAPLPMPAGALPIMPPAPSQMPELKPLSHMSIPETDQTSESTKRTAFVVGIVIAAIVMFFVAILILKR